MKNLTNLKSSLLQVDQLAHNHLRPSKIHLLHHATRSAVITTLTTECKTNTRLSQSEARSDWQLLAEETATGAILATRRPAEINRRSSRWITTKYVSNGSHESQCRTACRKWGWLMSNKLEFIGQSEIDTIEALWREGLPRADIADPLLVIRTRQLESLQAQRHDQRATKRQGKGGGQPR